MQSPFPLRCIETYYNSTMREKKFATLLDLIELFALRACGHTIYQLSVRYGTDVRAIRYHLKRHGVVPMYIEVWHPKGVWRAPKQNNYTDKNPGKMYAEYLRRAQENRWHRSR